MCSLGQEQTTRQALNSCSWLSLVCLTRSCKGSQGAPQPQMTSPARVGLPWSESGSDGRSEGVGEGSRKAGRQAGRQEGSRSQLPGSGARANGVSSRDRRIRGRTTKMNRGRSRSMKTRMTMKSLRNCRQHARTNPDSSKLPLVTAYWPHPMACPPPEAVTRHSRDTPLCNQNSPPCANLAKTRLPLIHKTTLGDSRHNIATNDACRPPFSSQPRRPPRSSNRHC